MGTGPDAIGAGTEPDAIGAGTEPDAIAAIGSYVTRREAEMIADRLDYGESIASATKSLDSRQAEFRRLVEQAGLRQDRAGLARILRGIVGARSQASAITPLWTMPGQLARSGPLTTSIPRLIDGARMSITCATYNFAESSQLWDKLRAAAQRPEIALKVYVDTAAIRSGWPASAPTAEQLAAQLSPGRLLQTRCLDRDLVRTHAKFLAVDHRFLIVTSANFSFSAENRNVEFGVRIDDTNLTESVEREMAGVENTIYEVVSARKRSRAGHDGQ
jgi:phosphatidylserine/phosphatidylglycerophosphate/cardiolipin synthase-like enzyme